MNIIFLSAVICLVSLGCGPKIGNPIDQYFLAGETSKKTTRQIMTWKKKIQLKTSFQTLRAMFGNIKVLSPLEIYSSISVIEWDNEADARSFARSAYVINGVESIVDDLSVDLEIRSKADTDPQGEPYFFEGWHMKQIGIENIWRQTLGSSSTLVAVVDLGFEQNHPEFFVSGHREADEQKQFGDGLGAWYLNKFEIPENRIDDDNNGLIDDISGWNFATQGSNLIYGAAPNHGTATASIIGGRINHRGSLGLCPRCTMLPVVIDDRMSSIILAYQYIQRISVAVINNSWGFKLMLPEMNPLIKVLEEVHSSGRNGLGTGIVFAMSNAQKNDCIGSSPDISSLSFLVAVSGVDSSEIKIKNSGFGDCVDLVAPTSPSKVGGIVTADRQGSKGSNNGRGGDLSDWDYTRQFYGTSAAAPQVTAALALLLSIHPEYKIDEAQKILFSRAKKVDPGAGAYDPLTGKSLLYGFGMLSLEGAKF